MVGATCSRLDLLLRGGHLPPRLRPLLLHPEPGSAGADVTITYMKGDGTHRRPGDQRARPTPARPSTPRTKLGRGQRRRPRLLRQGDVHQRAADNRRAPHVLQLQRGTGPGGTTWWEPHLPPTTFYFAEGTCRPGFDPYFCIQNPGEHDANVNITYMKGDGTTDNQTTDRGQATPASTVIAKDKLGRGERRRPRLLSQGDVHQRAAIIAERPMYFNYNGAYWTGGTTWWERPLPLPPSTSRRAPAAPASTPTSASRTPGAPTRT